MKASLVCLLSLVAVAMSGTALAQKVYLYPEGRKGGVDYSYSHSFFGSHIPKSDAANVIKTSRGRILAVALRSTQRGKDVLDDIGVYDTTVPDNIRVTFVSLDERELLKYDDARPPTHLRMLDDPKRGRVIAIWPHPDRGRLDSFSLAVDDLYRWRAEKARKGGYDLQVGAKSYKALFAQDDKFHVVLTLFERGALESPSKRIKPEYAVLIHEFVGGQVLNIERQPIGDSGYYLEKTADNNFHVTTRDGGTVPTTASDTEKIFASSKPAVVYITHFAGEAPKIGTGFLCNQAGDILTNKHVVAGAPDDMVTVKYFDGTITTGRVVARDANDLALVRPTTKPKELRVLEFAHGTPRVGETLLVIGHPKDFRWSLTKGTVSAVRDAGDAVAPGFLQTDAAINPGNSGGPAINMDGKVVGVVTLKAQAEGIGLALPAKLAREFVEKQK